MGKSLKRAMAEISKLPQADQDRIGCKLLEYVEKLVRLRADLEVGIRQLDAGQGRELDIETLLARFRSRHQES